MSPNRNRHRRASSFKPSGNGVITSFCNDIFVKGQPAQIAQKWQDLAEAAEKAGDIVLSQRYFQQTEHYNKTVDCT